MPEKENRILGLEKSRGTLDRLTKENHTFFKTHK